MALLTAARCLVRVNVPSIGVRSFCERKIHDHFEHATGKEKYELEAIRSGNLDPFDEAPRKRGVGTKDQPNLVPSIKEKRLVGCICEEDAVVINYMWVHKGELRRCMCGHWFKLVDRD
ncbi:cytochrome c oxidase subunit 5B, mitochondrial [Galendromus occidentalis]|uniref:Cytochrome c oxidase subunit 5B, mitochondrial n=1 Tax=Galendromus occidentalis TaxID=34638 RepID=A0AAJ6QWL7_9ACAR|nr:cytochrome c oxidase subunit 5B, mitochondrial [Galendromus occidentalis]